jgi:transcriptional regulator with GAF, ATPase, and Fis domain
LSQDSSTAVNAAVHERVSDNGVAARHYGPAQKDSRLTDRNGSANPRAPAFVQLKPASRPALLPIIGSSKAIKQVRELIVLYADEQEPVLINGETGSGKEPVAVNIHRQSGRRCNRLEVHNVGRATTGLVSDDIFGHARGAFTGAIERRAGFFEMANGSSLFLDEIGDMPIELQANLLRVIEDGVITPIGASASFKVDVRLIAATNHDLPSAVDAGRFREDLYYRLSVLRIDVPPLRERGEDIIELSHYHLAEMSRARGRKFTLTQPAETVLMRHNWPGNVRELFFTLSRSALHAKGGVIGPDSITLTPRRRAMPALDAKAGVELITNYLVAAALEAEGGKVIGAARLTRLDREKLGKIRALLEEEGLKASRLREDLRKFLGF